MEGIIIGFLFTCGKATKVAMQSRLLEWKKSNHQNRDQKGWSLQQNPWISSWENASFPCQKITNSTKSWQGNEAGHISQK